MGILRSMLRANAIPSIMQKLKTVNTFWEIASYHGNLNKYPQAVIHWSWVLCLAMLSKMLSFNQI
jgi:hypothetical protein